ncbi:MULTISPECIES: hypothetical protein [Rhodococcus]|uniref:hypothetical protein n=1 Tax=Rhodococcus TaxID=1827 RepID=UPI0005C1D94C|nr:MULTISPECIES: hypothetical protein [Rhodococcus]UOT08426.1 hypothetical protein MPY17_36645 [Rhodococcus opacus]
MAEFDAGVVGGEVPLDLALIGVGLSLPGGEFGVEDSEVLDVPVQVLAGQRGELDLGDVEPRAVFGGVVDLEPLRERERLGRLEGLVERSDAVGA